ncbi:hypothetical protein Zmor_014818 [Zophobas morio]|uniref:Uncharacterized protein n=1 Tax=Zophobas morio TaxID=2755281 RepID=A0AA38II68_9CUCU|nr:hypothetical protein Zmor_014818 [Zophobas morio]
MEGKRLSSRAQDIVFNLIEHFALEKENGGPLISLNGIEQRVADVLSVTRRTVSKIKRKTRRASQSNKITAQSESTETKRPA